MANKRATIRLDVDIKKQQLNGLNRDLGKVNKTATTSAERTAALSNRTKTLSGSLRGAAQGVAAFQGPLGPLAGRLSSTASLLGSVNAGIQTVTASTKALRIALISTGIGAIVVALGTLVQAFRSTQEGADRLARFMVPLKSAFGAIWGVIQQLSLALNDTLVNAFNDPKQAIIDLGTSIRDVVINRFKAMIDTAGALGTVIGRSLRFDFEGARNAADDFNDGLKRLFIGSEETRNSLLQFGRDTKDAFEFGQEAGAEIQRLTERIRQLRIEQAVPLSRQRRQYEELRNIVRDTGRTEEARLEAADRAISIRQNVRDQELELLDLEIQKLELQQQINDTSDEELLKLEQLRAKREEVAASTERELGRVLVQRSRVIQQIDEQQQKEAEAQRERALANQQYHIDVLADEIETADKILEINAMKIGSIAELEKRLKDKRLQFNEALTDAERQSAREQIEALEQKIALLKGESEATDELIKKNKKVGTAGIENARNLQDAKRGVLDMLFNQIIMEAIRSAFESVPFPFNVFAAGGAGLAAKSVIRSAVPGFADGVTNFSGGTALVGERGPELVNLPKGSNVVTNENTQDLMGRDIPGRSDSFERALAKVNWSMESKVRGTDLLFLTRKQLQQESDLGADGTI